MDSLLSGQDIICLALRSWHSPWKANQQLMSRLARSNRVLYVGPFQSLREAITEIRARVPRGPTLERQGPKLHIYREPRLLARSRLSRPFNWTTDHLRLVHVRHLARRLGLRSPILWVFDPMLHHAVGTFGEKLVIYHVIDNYIEYRPADAVRLRQIVAKNEETMLGVADLVFAVSQTLHQRCLRYNPNSFLVPNGVDYDRFHQAVDRPTIPGDVQKIPRPIVGYVGVIESNMNFPLLQQIADDHPEWSLMLVGPDELSGGRSEFDALLRRPNVFYLGFKPVDEVPNYIKCCDVGIMPDKERTDGDSLKLYEYLACGKPVVALADPSVRRFEPLVRIAHDAGDFARCVRESLSEGPSLASARMATAQENSWTTRVHTLGELINRHLARGQTKPSLSVEPPGSQRARIHEIS